MCKTTKRLLGTIIAMASISAQADPVLWTIEDLNFANDYEFRPPASDPNGDLILFINELVSVTGSFVYDADTGIASEVNITSPDGQIAIGCTAVACTPDSTTFSDFAGSTYSAGQYNLLLDRLALFDPPDVLQLLLLTFADPLTNLGGVVDISLAFEYQCGAACPGFDATTMPFRTELKGTGARVVGVAVPEPSTLMLFSVGLAGMGLMRRRRKN